MILNILVSTRFTKFTLISCRDLLILQRPAKEAHYKLSNKTLHLHNLSTMSHMMHRLWCHMMAKYNLVGAAVLLAWQRHATTLLQLYTRWNMHQQWVIAIHRVHLYYMDGTRSKKENSWRGVLDTTLCATICQ